MRKRIWAGLDIGVETTSACVINDHGEILQEATCPTDLGSINRELRWLKRYRSACICLEAGVGLTLARGLRSLGYTVHMYEARQLSKFLRVRRNKTDEGDANGIAEAGRIGGSVVSKVYLKSLDSQLLLSRLTIRQFMVRQRIAAINLLCRQLEQYGGRISRPSRSPSKLRAQADAEITKLFGKHPGRLQEELCGLLDYCQQLLSYQLAVDREFKRLAADNEVCLRFMQIPGVGPLAALTFYATIGDPHRFRRSADVGSYLGLTPRLWQSGLNRRQGRISKMGSCAARSLLVHAATAFMRSRSTIDTELRNWTFSIEQRRGRARSRVALARKLAVTMVALWKSGTTFVLRSPLTR